MDSSAANTVSVHRAIALRIGLVTPNLTSASDIGVFCTKIKDNKNKKIATLPSQ